MSARAYIAPPAPPEELIFSEAILWAGDLVAGRGPIRMSTVLGSCVSVCLFDRQHQFGGMNHYLVPRGGETASHGEWATARLVERMRQLGSQTADLQGKIFGGGSPLKLVNETYAVGVENVNVARRVLASFSIPIIAERTGHGAGIRLFFENWTGVVWLRAHEPKATP